MTDHLVSARTGFSCCCSQKPACAPVLSYPAFAYSQHTSTTWTQQHFQVTWKIPFCTVITRQMQWDRSTQAGALSGGWARELQGRRESGGRGEGGFPWARSPLQSPSQGSAGRKLGISLLSALEISDTGSCSCGSPEGVPVMKPEGGGLKRSFCGWCNLGQPCLGSDTSDLVTTCSVVTAPLLAWWSQEREEKKKRRGVE